ncbi:hypothetical protein EU98_1804 [Prochlorococcus marinus str. MIT 9314]|uniref:VTC domain-containing protein n=2 Tax=Prochlorococcaceae TaxID=2881426 RepID=A0A0A2AHJ2_PROMR|nr:hypothetical protein EU98_1804 [Prochlorococcus marinus str. MIT 9314]
MGGFMEKKLLDKNKYRYERKMSCSKELLNEIFDLIKFHPSQFNEIYKERKVNSIYLDNFDYESYNDSVSGIMTRNKVRIRWYGENNLIKPSLEIKSKNGDVGSKNIFNLEEIDISKPFTFQSIRAINSNRKFASQYPFLLDFINPTLYCSYLRRYFLNREKTLRITLDYQIKYMKPFINANILKLKPIQDNSVVLELKYNSDLDIQKTLEFKSLPFRTSRFSKYSNGIYAFNQ